MTSVFALSPEIRRKLLLGAALTAVLVVVAGCGVRGALEPPPGAEPVAPKAAASQRLAAPVAQVSTSDRGNLDNDRDVFFQDKGLEGQTRPVKVAPAPVDPNAPKKKFFLDSLVK